MACETALDTCYPIWVKKAARGGAIKQSYRITKVNDTCLCLVRGLHLLDGRADALAL